MSNKKHLQVVDFSNPNADKIISTSTKNMSNEKETSLDYYINATMALDIARGLKNINIKEYISRKKEIIDQAKEMYSKELELAYEDGKEIRHILNTIEKNQQ